MVTDDYVAPREHRLQPTWRVILTVAGLIGVFLGFVAWAISSPIGSSPDEDYHLGSIWCPPPAEDTGCVFIASGADGPSVEVPQTVYGAAACHAFEPWTNASCVDDLSDDQMVQGYRFDKGSYPRGFFQFQHLLVGKDVQKSVILMRVTNVLIALGVTAFVASMSTPAMRRNALTAALVAWVPMGLYYVASINPSSWAITGIFVYAFAALSASRSDGWRRWALLGAAAVGATLAMTSRGDAAFYVLVVSVALWMLIPLERKRVPELALTAVASVLGILVLLSTGQASNLTSGADWPTYPEMSRVQLLVANFLSIPEFFANFWGLIWGPGWLDTPLIGWTTLIMLMIAGGVLLVAAADLYPRKVLASVVIVVGLLGIPVVSMTLRHVQPVTLYQPRYLLPLLAVFFLIWFLRKDGSTYFQNAPRLWFVVALASIANFFALRQVILRYAVGIDDRPLNGLVRFHGVEWWPWSVPPEIVLWGGSLAFGLGLVALFVSIPKGQPSLVQTRGFLPRLVRARDN